MDEPNKNLNKRKSAGDGILKDGIHQIQIRTEIIPRDELTRKEYIKMLSTPKGVRYEFKRKTSSEELIQANIVKKTQKVEKKELHHCSCIESEEEVCNTKPQRCSKSKKTKRKKTHRTLKSCDDDRPYVHNFLADVWSYLTPEIIDSLKGMLIKEFGMAEREAEEFVLNQRLKTLFKGTPRQHKTPFPCFPPPPVDDFPPFPCPPPDSLISSLLCPPTEPPCPPRDSLISALFNPPPNPPCPPPCFPCPPPDCFPCPPPDPPCPPPCFPCPPPDCFPCPPPNLPCPPPPCFPCPLPCFPCPPFPCPIPPPCPPTYPCCTGPEKYDRPISKVKRKIKKKTLGLRYYWLKNMMNILTIKLNDYVAMSLSTRRTKRARCIAEVILKHLSDITGEPCSLSSPKTRAQKIMVFISDRLATWLANISCSCDDRGRALCEASEQGGGDDNDDDLSEGGGKQGGKQNKNSAGKKKSQKNKSSPADEKKNPNELSKNETNEKDATDEVENVPDNDELPEQTELGMKRTKKLEHLESISNFNIFGKESISLVGLTEKLKFSGYFKKLLPEEQIGSEVIMKPQEQINRVFKSILDEIKHPSTSLNKRSLEIALVIKSELEQRMDETLSETGRLVLLNLCENIGYWVDSIVTGAIEQHPGNEMKSKLTSTISQCVDELHLKQQIYSDFATEQITKDRPLKQEIKSLKNFDLQNETLVNVHWLNVTSDTVDSYTHESLFTQKTQIRESPIFDRKLLNEWTADTQKHALQWKRNKLYFREAAQIWQSKMQGLVKKISDKTSEE